MTPAALRRRAPTHLWRCSPARYDGTSGSLRQLPLQGAMDFCRKLVPPNDRCAGEDLEGRRQLGHAASSVSLPAAAVRLSSATAASSRRSSSTSQPSSSAAACVDIARYCARVPLDVVEHHPNREPVGERGKPDRDRVGVHSRKLPRAAGRSGSRLRSSCTSAGGRRVDASSICCVATRVAQRSTHRTQSPLLDRWIRRARRAIPLAITVEFRPQASRRTRRRHRRSPARTAGLWSRSSR